MIAFLRSTFLLSLLFFLGVNTAISQNKKYQGLLWEITGNGLTEPSYLYGTMHVSNKLAFNVSDSFYLCLTRAKAVALESSPDTWMEDYRDMGVFGGGGYKYYQGFYESAYNIYKPGKAEIYELLENKNGLMNQILYRFNPGSEDYQEETYLDMFIYQSGAKSNKPIYSLEEMAEVYNLSILAMMPDKEEKVRDNSYNSYLDDNQGYRRYEMLEEAYRLGDLDIIDSLSKTGNRTKLYHHYFIVERNKNMVNRLDSLMKIHSIFTGIGAAHLPGDEGAIELLRDKGYTVRAVSTKSSGKGQKMKQKLSALYRPLPFTPTTTDDKNITVSVPGKLFEMPTGIRGKMEYLAPEPINGGYFSVIRLFTYGPLFNKTPEDFMASFDSLVYIATPGEIVRKSPIVQNGYKGYEIVSETSKNSMIEYKVFFTPTEIVIFKGTGLGNYIERPEPQTFFSKISLAPASSEWQTVSPKFGGATWKMKGTVSHQDEIDQIESAADPLYQSYDISTGDYFMVMRTISNDMSFIEEDSFDLAYLGESFAKSLGYEVNHTTEGWSDRLLFIEQELKKDEDHPDLKDDVSIRTIAKGGVYFLMLSTGKKEVTRTFFDSFKFDTYKIDRPYETYTDSVMSYTVQTILKEDKFNSEEAEKMIYRQYQANQADEEDQSYQYKNETRYHFLPETGESIFVKYRKFNSYSAGDSIQSFFEYQSEVIVDGQTQHLSNKSMYKDGNNNVMTFTLTDTGSTRGIYSMMYQQHGAIYFVQTLIDTISGPSDYQATFFRTFKPLDTLMGRDLFEDKADLFFSHVNGTDSTNRSNAMKSIEKIEFKEKDVDRLIALYSTYDYDEKTENEYRENIIRAFGEIEDPKAYQFLEETYNNNSFNSNLQFAILSSLAWTETQPAADLIKKLLLTNTAVTDDNYKMNFFNDLYDSLELTKSYFPEMLELSSYPEYKSRIVELLAAGYMDSVYSVNNFITEKKMIMRDATIELKRTLSDQEKDEEEDYYNYYGNTGAAHNFYYHTILLDYYALMCGLKSTNDPMIKTFFDGIDRVEDQQFILETQIINHELGLAVDTAKINKVITDREYTVWAYNRLNDYDMLEYFTPVIDQEEFVFGYLYSSGYDEEEDSVVFLRKVYVNNGKDTGYVYFFKRKTPDLKNWMIDYVGVQPLDSTGYNAYNQLTKSGLSVKTDAAIEETIEKILERFMLRHRQRVNTGYDYDWSGLEGLFEDY